MSVTQDWRFKNECFPFEDDDKYYITVESQYQTPGNDKEGRLSEARRAGVSKLLKFYGKDPTYAFGIPQNLLKNLPEGFNTTTSSTIFDLSIVEDYFVSYRPCVLMKVLVSVPKADFDRLDDDPAACKINKPAEGYLSAFLPVGDVSFFIESVADGMLALLQSLYRSNKFISNVNIPREINRLRAAGRTIQRYIDLNQIPSIKIEDPECVQPNETNLQLEIGFSFDYNAVFALVDNDQYTIGYDCFLENVNLNHNTTINYLINIQQMYIDLQLKDDINFNVFSFFRKYTIPTPVIETKRDPLDGLNKYQEDGELNVLANLAKLITLDLDINLCKTAEEKAAEDRTLFNQETITRIQRTVQQTKDAVGNDTLSKGGRERLRERLGNIGINAKEGDGLANLKILYEDVLAKVDLACVLEESIQCVAENMITRFGQEVFNDPDLGKVLRIQNVSLGGLNNNCALNTQEKCDGTPDLNLKVGLPVFQGISIPDNLPTLDFLADTIDIALQNLYNRLVNVLATTVLGIFESTCDLILSFPDGIAGIPGQFQEWLSETLGVDLETLKDPEAFADALRSGSGKGFVGIIGKAASRVEGAFLDVYTETGISINFPNESGQVEEFFISPEFIVNYSSNVSTAIEEVEAVLTPSETQSLFKGVALPEVLELAYKCATRNNKDLFPTQQDFEDTMSELGNLLNPSFLTEDLEDLKTVASTYCDLGDDTSSNALRNFFLSEKDSELSSEEVNQIIEKEKQRGKTRLLESLDTLEEFKAGNLAPAFPSIFGSDGLIPKTPAVIDEITKLVAELSLQGIVTNFSSESVKYADFWEALNNQSPGLIYANPVVSEKNDAYSIGYEGAQLRADNAETGLVEEFIPILIEDSGDDEDKGISNEAGNESLKFYFGINYRSSGFESTMFRKYLEFAYPGTFNITDEHKLLFRDINVFIEDNDTGSDAVYQEYFDDPIDSNIYYLVIVNEGEGTVEVFKRQRINEEVTTIRQKGFENEIVKLSLSSILTKIVTQKSGGFRIGSTVSPPLPDGTIISSLGTKFTTGRLRTDIFNTSFETLQIQQLRDIPLLSIEAQTFGEDLDLNTLNESLIKQFVAYIDQQRIDAGASTSLEYGIDLTEVDLSYPTNDILAYSSLSNFSSEFSSRILAKILSGEICDTLSTTRRTNATTALRMLLRIFIVEQVLMSYHVFNSFDISFMKSDLFISSVYKTFSTEISKYQNSFTTLESTLLNEFKEVALKYYEFLRVLGEDNRNPESGKLAIEQMIVDEVGVLRNPINNTFGFQFNSKSWDDFLIDNIFGEVESINEEDVLEKNTIASVSFEQPSFVFYRHKTMGVKKITYNYDLLRVTGGTKTEEAGGDTTPRVTYEVSEDYTAETILSVQCEQERDSFATEAMTPEPVIQKDYIVIPTEQGQTTASHSFGTIFTNFLAVGPLISDADIFERILELSYPGTFGTIDYAILYRDIVSFIQYYDQGNPGPVDRTFDDPLDSNISYYVFVNEGYGLVYVEKRQAVPQPGNPNLPEDEQKEEEIYSNLRKMMIESQNYQKLFYDLVPVNSIVSLISLYQYSALSDQAVYPNGFDLYNMMSKTKLSTLQILAAAIYGEGKISYQDPFLEKAGTDQV